MIRHLGMLVVACALAGCGTDVWEVPLNAPPHAMTRKDPNSIAIFTTQQPPRPYTEVALMEAQRQSAFSRDTSSAVMNQLRSYAAGRGCDALILHAGGSGGTNYASQPLVGYRATCIVYQTPKD